MERRLRAEERNPGDSRGRIAALGSRSKEERGRASVEEREMVVEDIVRMAPWGLC
jgi:hypothetical protein